MESKKSKPNLTNEMARNSVIVGELIKSFDDMCYSDSDIEADEFVAISAVINCLRDTEDKIHILRKVFERYNR